MLTCDRCNQQFEGSVGAICSAGCYMVDRGFWKTMANPEESIVCDKCMWADPRYIEVYGHVSQ